MDESLIALMMINASSKGEIELAFSLFKQLGFKKNKIKRIITKTMLKIRKEESIQAYLKRGLSLKVVKGRQPGYWYDFSRDRTLFYRNVAYTFGLSLKRNIRFKKT